MKQIILMLSMILLYFVEGYGQTNGELYSKKVANRMKDSLQLSQKQQSELYVINLQLVNAERMVWKGSSDKQRIQKNLQRVENTRDSLYRNVLNEQQFLLYKKKKRTLLNNN